MRAFIFIILIALAITAPLRVSGGPTMNTKNFPGWPQEVNGNILTELPLSEREAYFAADFPGKIGRFSDGEREIVIRWIAKESRKLHPSADCFRGAGHNVSAPSIYRDTGGTQWSCFNAERQHKTTRVCERIYDDLGNSWSDTSSWFWDALQGNSSGPWWAITVAESAGRA